MIKVTPEGREGVWEADKQSVIDFLMAYESDVIHNVMPASSMMLGADWSKESVIDKVNDSERIAILTGDAFNNNMGHALSVITNNELLMFDIGEIKLEDLL